MKSPPAISTSPGKDPDVGRRPWLPRPAGRRVSQRLARIGERLAVHFLVERGELREIPQVLRRSSRVDALEHPREDGSQDSAAWRRNPAAAGPSAWRAAPPPNRKARRRRGRTGDGERPIAAVAQAPVLLEPSQVADLPQRRIDDGKPRPQQSLAGEIRREQQACACAPVRAIARACRCPASRSIAMRA